jgi:hypothetical protein
MLFLIQRERLVGIEIIFQKPCKLIDRYKGQGFNEIRNKKY